jgi:ketosteroid isomerase-like protein
LQGLQLSFLRSPADAPVLSRRTGQMVVCRRHLSLVGPAIRRETIGVMTLVVGIVGGIALMVVVRVAVLKILIAKFRRDVRALSAGNYHPLLKSYARDAVIHFNEGDHRWSGTHVGSEGIEAFLQSFVDAGLHGEIREAFAGGWPWKMTVLARFDDVANLDGQRLYSNHTVLLCRTRWGKVVRQEDYYEDTSRIEAFEHRLRDLGR